MHRNNKYNVRAVRLELEDYARNGTWNKFRNKVSQFLTVKTSGGSISGGDKDNGRTTNDSSSTASSSSSILQDIVLCKSSLKQKNNRGSLLHIILHLYHKTKKNNSSKSTILTNNDDLVLVEILRDLTNNVPETLLSTDAYLQTPLHVAIERQYSPKVIQALLLNVSTSGKAGGTSAANYNNNPLYMADRHGDTPLLKAVKDMSFNASSYIELLLAHDAPNNQQCTLLKSTRRKGRVALWYAVSHEVRTCAFCHESYTPSDEVQLLLLATQRALLYQHSCNHQMSDATLPPNPTTTTTTANSIDKNRANGTDPSTAADRTCNIRRILSALVTCAPLLEKLAVKLLDFLLSSKDYQRALLTLEDNRDTLLHQLCRQQCIAEMTQSTTISLLLDQILNFLSRQQTQPNFETSQNCSSSHLVRLLSHPNEDGNLPLHLAVLELYSIHYVCELKRACPLALLHKNHAGELPLHLALKSFKHPNDGHAPWLFAVEVQELWQAEPLALQIQDGPTQLYPFALAASCQFSCCTLDLVYRLLLAAPEVLGSAVNECRQSSLHDKVGKGLSW